MRYAFLIILPFDILILQSWKLWSWVKVTAILQRTFSNQFPYMNVDVTWLTCHWNLFPRVQSLIWEHSSDISLAPFRRQAIIWSNDGTVYWRIYSSLGLNELNKNGLLIHCGLLTPYGDNRRYSATLAQRMTCCLTAPKHCLNQCWLIKVISITITCLCRTVAHQCNITFSTKMILQIQIQILVYWSWFLVKTETCRWEHVQVQMV